MTIDMRIKSKGDFDLGIKSNKGIKGNDLFESHTLNEKSMPIIKSMLISFLTSTTLNSVEYLGSIL